MLLAETTRTVFIDLSAYPRWMVVLVGTLLAVVVIWILMKVLKWALWLLLFAVLVGGVAYTVGAAFPAARVLTGESSERLQRLSRTVLLVTGTIAALLVLQGSLLQLGVQADRLGGLSRVDDILKDTRLGNYLIARQALLLVALAALAVVWRVRATAVSMAMMRPAKDDNTWPSSHSRSAAPCAASRRSMSNTPVSSSRIVIADRYSAVAETERAHFTTLRFALPDFALRSSETTSVSSRNITSGRWVWRPGLSTAERRTRSCRCSASTADR